MHPALTNSLSVIRNTYRSAKQKPVTTGAAALGVAAVTGVSLGAAFGPSANVGAAAGLDVNRHPASVSSAARAGSPHYNAATGLAQAGRPSPASLPSHPAVSAKVAVKPEHHAAPQRKAPVKHQAPARPRPAAKAAVKHPAGHTPAKAPAKAPAKKAPAKHQAPARHAAGHAAVARRATPVKPARPFQIYDSVTPGSIPAHQRVATYATGNYAASPAQVAGRGQVMWIDTTGSDYAASVLDVEPGDATPTLAANWAYHRLTQHRTGLARIYTMISEWPAVKSAVATLPAWMQSHVRWWIADPTGSPHIVPGAAATQWYWGKNYDITNASSRF